jgi:hypothetical protein
MHPGFGSPSLGAATPGVLGAFPGSYGPGYVDPTGGGFGLNGGYGFSPYGLHPYATPFVSTTPFGGFSANPYAMGFPNSYATGFQTGAQLSDQDLEKQVEDILGLDPLTCNADLQVQCQDQVIMLTGTVTNKLVKIAAGNDCWIIPGVRDVNNSIQIKTRSQQGQKQRQTVGAGSR